MNSHVENTNRFTSFWPLGLLALSLALFLGWQVTAAIQQYNALLRLEEQQDVLAGQAAQAESKLKDLMVDLLDLAKTDADARAIAGKYGIKFNPVPAPVKPIVDAGLPAPKSSRAPRDAAAGSGTWTGDDAPRK